MFFHAHPHMQIEQSERKGKPNGRQNFSVILLTRCQHEVDGKMRLISLKNAGVGAVQFRVTLHRGWTKCDGAHSSICRMSLISWLRLYWYPTLKLAKARVSNVEPSRDKNRIGWRVTMDRTSRNGGTLRISFFVQRSSPFLEQRRSYVVLVVALYYNDKKGVSWQHRHFVTLVTGTRPRSIFVCCLKLPSLPLSWASVIPCTFVSLQLLINISF